MLASLVYLDLFSPVELALNNYSIFLFVDDLYGTLLIVRSLIDGLDFDLPSLMIHYVANAKTRCLREEIGEIFTSLIF